MSYTTLSQERYNPGAYTAKADTELDTDGCLTLIATLTTGHGVVERNHICLDKRARARLRALIDKLDA